MAELENKEVMTEEIEATNELENNVQVCEDTETANKTGDLVDKAIFGTIIVGSAYGVYRFGKDAVVPVVKKGVNKIKGLFKKDKKDEQPAEGTEETKPEEN